MAEPILPPLKPIPIKDRISVVYLEKGNLDVLEGAFVVVDKTGVRKRCYGLEHQYRMLSPIYLNIFSLLGEAGHHGNHPSG
jgi:hypothetical protein